MDEQRKHLIEILKKFNTCMLVSKHSGGSLNAHPMTIAKIDDQCFIWFLTHINNTQVGDFLNDSQALVTAQNDHAMYLSIIGNARMLQNPEVTSELWRKEFDVWFPKGASDPDLVVIEFEPYQGEYWDSRGLKKVSYAAEMGREYVSGETSNVDQDKFHGKVVI